MDNILKHAPNLRLGQTTKIKPIIHNYIAQQVFLQEKKTDEMSTMKDVIHKYVVVSWMSSKNNVRTHSNMFVPSIDHPLINFVGYYYYIVLFTQICYHF